VAILTVLLATLDRSCQSRSLKLEESSAPPVSGNGKGSPQNQIVEIPDSTNPGTDFDRKRLRSLQVQVKEHFVKNGENYWSIAKDYDISVPTLLGANPGMPFTAEVGQSIWVPSRDGVLHVVEKGQNLNRVAELYAVEEKVVRNANFIPWWSPLKTGDILFVPGVKPIRMGSRWKEYYDKRGFFGVPFASWGKGWTSRYGQRSDPLTGEHKMHRGMDFKASTGTDVFAAAAGRVTCAALSGGYGNLIILVHANGYTTYYGHLSKILVKNGARVRRGQLIGKVGATGRVTGPHLHFEIRKNGKQVDPLPLI